MIRKMDLELLTRVLFDMLLEVIHWSLFNKWIQLKSLWVSFVQS